MSVSRMSPSILFFLILSVWQVEAEEKCECVDYNRDWYVIVTSFTSGLVLSTILAFISVKCYFRHCGRVTAPTHTVESQETLGTRTEGGVDQLYEEVQGVENSGFEASKSFTQALRSDSKTNLVVDVSFHGEPTAKYQHPRFEMEPIYSNYGTAEDKSNDQPGSNKNDSIPQLDHKHPSSDYHYPEPSYTNMDVRVQESTLDSDVRLASCQETNLTSKSKVDYQQPTKFTPPKPPRNLTSSSSPSERYKKLPIKNSKIPTNSKTPLKHALQTKYAASSQKLVSFSPPSDHAADDKNRKDLESREQNREGEAAAFITEQSSGQNLWTVVKSQLPSPNFVIGEKSNCEADYQKPEIDAESSENERVNKLQTTPGMSHEESDREAGYQVPEIDAEFLENEGVNKLKPTPGISHVESDREAGYQVPKIEAEFLENKACNPSPSLGNVEKNRETGHQVSEMDTRFFKDGDKSLIQPPPALPLRRPSQDVLSISLEDLPSKTPASQNSPFARPITTSTNSEPPELPSKASQKSPSVTPSVVAASSPLPTLPVKAPSVKSLKVVPSKSVKPPQLPPKAAAVAAPPLPAKIKPVSLPFYAELNEQNREDDAENYQRLTPTDKQ